MSNKQQQIQEITGHSDQIAYLNARLKDQNLHHGYIFIGQKSTGKTTITEKLASALLNTPQEKLKIHPDYTVIQREINPKTEKLREQISIDQINDLKAKISKTAIHGGYKVILIKDAEHLSTKAANAFLKTLEEPTKNTIMILTTTTKQKILPTIQSRTHHIEFKTATNKEITEALKTYKLDAQTEEYITKAASGRPGIAITLARDKEKLKNHKQETQLAKNCLHKNASTRILELKKLIPEYKEDHVETRKKLLSRIDLLETETRNTLLSTIESPNTQEQTDMSKDQAIRALKGIAELKKQLNAHINPKIALINLALSIK